MNPSSSTVKMQRWLSIVFLLIVVFCCVVVALAFVHRQNTGLLLVTASDSKAVITVSQDNHTAAAIGTGSAKVRLHPGTYRLAATSAGKEAVVVVRVSKHQTVDQSLKLGPPPRVPAVENINFEHTDSLIDSGLTDTQVSVLEGAFFRYKPTAQTISIDSSSVEPGPHNPNGTDPFTLHFTVNVDNVPLNATASYVGLDDARLLLNDPQSGSQIFDSYINSGGE